MWIVWAAMAEKGLWLSNQTDQRPLDVAIAVDVALGRLNGPVTCQQLNVAKGAAGFVDHASSSRDEGATARVRRAAVEAEHFICPAKPDDDAQRGHGPTALRANDRPLTATNASRVDQCLAKVGMQRHRTTAALFSDPILQLKGGAYLAAGVEDHVPGQFGNLSRAQAGFHREKNDQTVTKWMPRALSEKQEIVDMIGR